MSLFQKVKDIMKIVRREEMLDKIESYNFKFKTREEYLEYKEDWKKRYARASEEVQYCRRARKEFLWNYRPKGVTHIKRKTKIGSNPDYNTRRGSYGLFLAKDECGRLLEERQASKVLAGIQRSQRLGLEEQLIAVEN